MPKESQTQHLDTSADRPEIEFKVARDFIQSVEFGKNHGF